MLSQEPDAIVASKYCVNGAPHPNAIMQLLYTLEQAEMRHATTGSDPIPVPGLAVVGAVLEPVVCSVVGAIVKQTSQRINCLFGTEEIRLRN
jgi:hypothetical protein